MMGRKSEVETTVAETQRMSEELSQPRRWSWGKGESL
jgi:hypothetical protein